MWFARLPSVNRLILIWNALRTRSASFCRYSSEMEAERTAKRVIFQLELNSSHRWRTHSKAFAIISDSDSESSPLSFLSSYYGEGVKVHPIRLPHIVKRSISNRSFLMVLCLSSVDCGVSLLLSSGLGGESGGGSLVTSVTGGGAGGKGFALGLGCLVMDLEGRCTLGSAKKR